MKSITKLSLYFRAMRFFLIMGFAIGLLLVIVNILPAYIFADNPPEIYEGIVAGIAIATMCLLNFVIIGSAHIIWRGYFRIAKQEKFFGIRFNEEMRSAKINKTDYISHDWFINASVSGVIVFRKGFIVEIDNVERSAGLTTSKIIIKTANNKRIGVIGKCDTIFKLRKWHSDDILA